MSLLPQEQPTWRPQSGMRGAVLLEVVLALVLFVGAATLLSTALHSSMAGIERSRFQLHAENLAVSVMSELEMGVRPIASAGPELLRPPFELWSAQVVATPIQDDAFSASGLTQVEVVIRHKEHPVVRRLSSLLPPTATTPPRPDTSEAVTGGVP